MMLGPWADEITDAANPALVSIAGDRSIGMNLYLRGLGIIVKREKGLYNNLYIDNGGPPTAAVEIFSRPGRP